LYTHNEEERKNAGDTWVGQRDSGTDTRGPGGAEEGRDKDSTTSNPDESIPASTEGQ